MCLRLFSQKPMPKHQASINIQEPTKFKLEATHRRIILPVRTELDEPSISSAIRKTKLYKSEQELSKQPEFESEPTASKP